MDSKSYFSLPGVNSHALIEMMRSPLHCWAGYVDRQAPERDEPTPAMRFGTLVHTLVLEPGTFGRDFVLADEINRRTNAGKEEWAAIQKAGLTPITGDEYAKAAMIADAIHHHPTAGPMLLGGEAEKTIVVERQGSLLPLKGRIDYLHPDAGVVELKTANDASKRAFSGAVHRYSYHLSAAFYRMLVARHEGREESSINHTFVVVETKYPFAVAVYTTPAAMLEEGRALWVEQLERFDACVASGDWPSYPVDILDTYTGGGNARVDVELGELEL